MRRLLLVLGLIAALSLRAAARAGGGHSYSGSSHSSSSSHSSYSGSSSSSRGYSSGPSFIDYYLVWVLVHPVAGVPLTLMLLYLFFRMSNASAGNEPMMEGGFSTAEGQLSTRKAEELSKLRARDPAFDDGEFRRRASGAFLKIQEAWSAGDMGPARAFISDGVNERFGRQLAMLKARGLRNLMESVEIREVELLACRSDAHFDALWLRFAALASDRTVDAAGKTVSGGDGRPEFEEVWTFLRRPGAKTLKRPGLLEGHCPSCGAPLAIADAARCGACKAWVNSGEYDWVLSEITQSCEWSMREPSRDVDGWAAASAEDPALSLPALEDRASVIFWRWIEARGLGDAAPLRAVASPDLLKRLALDAGFDDAAVGAVEVVAFEDAGAWRKVHVSVKWSGGGEVRTHFLVLSRAAGAKTDARQGLRTARCPSCGAPPAERSEAACAYCGAALNEGKKDWILTDLIPFGEWRRPAAPARPAPASAAAAPPSHLGIDWGADLSPAAAFAVLASAMLADGEESLAERSFLDSYAQSRALPPVKAAQILAAAREGRLDAPQPESGAQAESLLRGMIRMSLADGVVTDAELKALRAFAGRFSLRPEDVAAMIEEERTLAQG